MKAAKCGFTRREESACAHTRVCVFSGTFLTAWTVLDIMRIKLSFEVMTITFMLRITLIISKALCRGLIYGLG